MGFGFQPNRFSVDFLSALHTSNANFIIYSLLAIYVCLPSRRTSTTSLKIFLYFSRKIDFIIKQSFRFDSGDRKSFVCLAKQTRLFSIYVDFKMISVSRFHDSITSRALLNRMCYFSHKTITFLHTFSQPRVFLPIPEMGNFSEGNEFHTKAVPQPQSR